MKSNVKNTNCYMNLPKSHVHSSTSEFNRSIMNRSVFATSLKNWFVGVVAVVILLLGGVSSVFAQTSSLYDFNTSGQLTLYFNGSNSNVTQPLSGGIGNTGSILVANVPTNQVFTTKEGYAIGAIGSTYTFSSYIRSVYNSGYSGLGFTNTSPSTQGTYANAAQSLGISVHGGGFEFHNGSTNYSGSWDQATAGSITAITQSSIFDLLNNGSASNWYKIIFRVTRTGTSTFTMRVEVWPSDANGTLLFSTASAIYEVANVTNTTLASAPLLYSYFAFNGQRVDRFDNYGVDLVGSTVVQSGMPVVLTSSATTTSNIITVNGNVTSANGSTVTERGFVYATTQNPTISNNKIIVGSGTGTFTGSTSTLPAGTYYVRSYATNANGTSYGGQEILTLTTTFTCPEIDQRNNGNGQSNQCPGEGTNAIANSHTSTAYASVPTTSKTGDIVFRWTPGNEPASAPAIGNVYINGALTATEVGPAAPYFTQGGFVKTTYCFYGVNLPNAGTYTLEFVDPQTGASLSYCTFTGNSNTTTTTPTLTTTVNNAPTISTPPNISTACAGASNGPVAITVGDTETALNALVISATSSNTTLIPNANLVITQPIISGAASLAYTPVAGQTGVSTITLTVTDGGGLTATSTFTITVTGSTISAVSNVVNDLACGSTATGSFTTTVTGGNAPFTYQWSWSGTLNGTYSTTFASPLVTPSPSLSPTNLYPGFFYRLTVTDACGTSLTSTGVQLNSVTAMTISATSTNVNCYGASTGSITAVTTNGATPITVTATNGTNTYTSSTFTSLGSNQRQFLLSNLPAGTYTVSAVDATSACNPSTTVTITQPAQLAISGTQTNIVCNGASTGAVDLSITGAGSSPATYTYAWSGPSSYTATTQDISSRPAGTYSVTVTDACNATASASFTLTQPAVLSGTIAATNVSACYGNTNGSIVVNNAAGGAGTYEYSINGTSWQSSNTFSNLAAGTYQVSIRDAATTTCVIDLDGSFGTILTQPNQITGTVTPTKLKPTIMFQAPMPGIGYWVWVTQKVTIQNKPIKKAATMVGASQRGLSNGA